MTGAWATDKICLELNKCVDVDLFYISEESFLPEDVDAILGFARPDQDMLLNPSATPKDRDYYLTALGAGEETMFSTRFRAGFVSWIDIGAPDAAQNTTEPIGIDIVDDYFWSVSNEGVRIGETEGGAFTFENIDGNG